MTSGEEFTKGKGDAKELLLADYRYLTESFWKSEQTGETRLNFFIGIVTVVVGALVSLITKEHGLRGEPLRLIVLTSLTALLVLGFMTMFRMLTRNENTDRYKQGCDTIRQLFKDHFDGDHVLVQYYPLGVPPEKRPKIKARKFGGLAHMVAAINSLLIAGLVSIAVYPLPAQHAAGELSRAYPSAATAFLLGIVAQLVYVTSREKRAKAKLFAGTATHAGGVVYQLIHGVVHYLLVQPSDTSEQWVLPKGHIELGEGHGEAALREVREEAGVVARLIGLVDRVEFKAKGESVNVKFYLMERLFEQASDERRKIEWFSFEEALKHLTHPENQYVLYQTEQRRLAFAKTQTNKQTESS